MDRGSFCSDGVYICRNRSETLLEWSSSGNLSVACILVGGGSDPFLSDQIGSGDGIVLMGIGWIQGIQQACVIFQTAILLAAAVGVCMLALGMGRKKELPFVPFLLAGYLVQYI